MTTEAAELWAVSIAGPDDLLAVDSLATALSVANRFNAWATNHFTKTWHPNMPFLWAMPVLWRGSADSHSKCVGQLGEYAWTMAIEDPNADSSELALIAEIRSELVRARNLFSGENVTLAALMEEVGELAKATFDKPRAAVRKEAVQVAVMAMRMVLDGDHTFDAWRADHGLDQLVDPALKVGETGNG